MVARAWLNTDSGTEPLATACTRVQPVAGQPVPGTPATCTAPAAEQDSALPDASAQTSPVGSNADGGPKKPPPLVVLRLLLSLKYPLVVGCSWSSPCRMAEVLCVAG